MNKVNKQAFQKTREQLNSAPVRARNALASAFVERVVPATPVDTGRARANYNVSHGAPDKSFDVNRYDVSGAETPRRLKEQIQATKPGRLFVANALPYILPLEYGHSRQAPAGMFEVSLLSVQARAAQILASEFKKGVK